MKKTMMIMVVAVMTAVVMMAGCEKQTTDLKGSKVYKTITHSYSKKIENENDWRTANGHVNASGVFYGDGKEIILYINDRPEVEVHWVNEETGMSGRTTLHGNVSNGYYYTTGLRAVE